MPKRKKSSSPPVATASDLPSAAEPTALNCFVCSKDCKNSTDLENHVASQHGPRFNCQCAHCTGKRRHDSAKLVEESTRQDDGKTVKLFKCIVCNYQVFLLCKCLSHIQMVHNTVPLTNQYECMKCNLGFATCDELNDHIKTHAGAQKIARCGFQHCKKCFTTASMLKTHLHNNHKITKPYEYLNSVKGSLINPKAPNMVLNSPAGRLANRGTPVSSNIPSTSKVTSAPSFTSAWTAADPPHSPPAGSANPASKPFQRKPDTKIVVEKREIIVNPEWTCKICNKEHKSQTSYNNHMVVFHKQKFSPKAKSPKAASSKKKRRRGDNDSDSDVSADWTSEDSDWEPSNTRRQSYTTRKSSRMLQSNDDGNTAPISQEEEKVAKSSDPATNNNTNAPGTPNEDSSSTKATNQV